MNEWRHQKGWVRSFSRSFIHSRMLDNHFGYFFSFFFYYFTITGKMVARQAVAKNTLETKTDEWQREHILEPRPWGECKLCRASSPLLPFNDIFTSQWIIRRRIPTLLTFWKRCIKWAKQTEISVEIKHDSTRRLTDFFFRTRINKMRMNGFK